MMKIRLRWMLLLIVGVAMLTFVVAALLISIYEKKMESRAPIVRIANVTELTTDPRPWGQNFPLQYETYLNSTDKTQTEHGGNNALPPSKLNQAPWLRRLFAGYAFSTDYREARGHAFMLHDQEVSRRVTEFNQSGACLHCHASVLPTYRRLGLQLIGVDPTAKQLATEFNQEAVVAGFRAVSQKDYADVHAEMLQTPDHFAAGESHMGSVHPVSCVDCHDPGSMRIRVTRPGFFEGISKLAESNALVPHLPSIQAWRDGSRDRTYDPNVDASRHEMRSFVCAQCHVEYYCAKKATLTYPWSNGLKMEDLEKEWQSTSFPDGSAFHDYVHQETGTKVFKAQHPEFELWSQGIHARAGVSCSDCHMPYEKQGATKFSNHSVTSPLLNIRRSCQTCHNVSEAELLARVETIQKRTSDATERAAVAMIDMLNAIVEARKRGATDEQLGPVRSLQRKAMWRLDFVSSENSKGFHADQEAVRILAESIDFSRQAQAAAFLLRVHSAATAPYKKPAVESR